MKRPLFTNQNLPIRILPLIFVILALTLSCRKNQTINPEVPSTYVAGMENPLMKWGQTVNGRWIPYLLNKAKRENPGMDNKVAIEVFTSYLAILNKVNTIYSQELVSDMGINVDNSPTLLSDLYKAHYTEINDKLGERGVMDALWEHYIKIPLSRVGSSGKKLSNDLPPVVDITACALPDQLRMFFSDLSRLPNLDNTSASELAAKLDESSGCRVYPLARIGVAVYNMRGSNNPTVNCSFYKDIIIESLDIFFSCPLPTSPGGNGGSGSGSGSGGGSGGSTPPTDPYPPGAVLEIDKSDITTKHPCWTKLISDKLDMNLGYKQMIEPFLTDLPRPSIKWTASNTPSWGLNGKYHGGDTGIDPLSGYGMSSVITLNSNMIDNGSQLLIAAVSVHETMHAYINYHFANNVEVEKLKRSLPSYMSSYTEFIYGTSAGGNFEQHLQMMEDQFDNMTVTLYSTFDGEYSINECRMAMLFGMDNPGTSTDFLRNSIIQRTYSALLQKYGITTQALNNWNIANVNAPIANRLPNTCP